MVNVIKTALHAAEKSFVKGRVTPEANFIVDLFLKIVIATPTPSCHHLDQSVAVNTEA